MKSLAGDLVASIKAHVTERLMPFQQKLDAENACLNAQRREIEALEARVAQLEARLAEKAPPTLRIA
jgi:BMFP domain-containing protein YqiC